MTMPEIIPDDLPYSGYGIECHRFGARRGGASIGCCAVDILQGFSHPPSAACPGIPFYDGDSRAPVLNWDGEHLHLIGTNEEVFLSYLLHGSFTNDAVPDHAFIAILTEEQCQETIGKEWLKILHREGFVHAGTVSNSVYCEYHPVHIFLLVRNTDAYMDESELEALGPPSYWKTLEAEETKGDPAKRYRELLTTFGQVFEYRPKETG